MKQHTRQQQKFIELRALTSKSFYTLSLELNTPVDQLLDWEEDYMNEIGSIRQRTLDVIKEKNETSFLSTYKYLSETYSRLKVELDKRDFSGLPTDKLYYMMDHVHRTLEEMEELDLDDISPDIADFLLDEDDDE